MNLTREDVLKDIAALTANYKTKDIDRLIMGYVKNKADVSALRQHILKEQKLHRIYFYVSLKQIKDVQERMTFIDKNLLFDDWWHTDELISFVSDLDFDTALTYARRYIISDDPFIRRWGYVMFISRLCNCHACQILPLIKNDDHYYVQMGEAWLIAELAVNEPDKVYEWLQKNDLRYNINGKAIQKICDSYRISDGWKMRFRELRTSLKLQKWFNKVNTA